MLSQYDFLTEQECVGVYAHILTLKKRWINRSMGLLPFFTLGTASYLDASSTNSENYYELAKQTNVILKTHFQIMYDKLIERLTQILGMPVQYAEEAALPGFHIFLYNKMFKTPIATQHFDLQFDSLKWNYKDVDRTNPISFTCPIVTPKEGCGLNFWDITYDEVKDLPKEEFEKIKASKEMHYFPYNLGKIALHRGLILHQIAPTKDIQRGDSRITLQGHGIICNGIMRLYW